MSAASKALTVRVAGAGGKGGGGGGEGPDTLRSTQYADIVDLLGEGEFEGLTNGLKSIYLDGVPLQNSDESFNFSGVQVWFTPGTQGQASITGGDGVQSEVGVGVTVVAATPVVRSITNPSVDSVRVTIAVPTLTETDTGSGDVHGSSFGYAIDVQSNGGGFVQVLSETISAKVTTRYTRSKVFALAGEAPWDIRVRRTSADAGSTYVANAFQWASYTEIQNLKLRHPNSAMVRLRINAQQFSRIPVRSYDVMALRMLVPTNYDTRAKTYTGVWDGNFKTAWTDCPAWMFYTAVTHDRFGLGRYFLTTDAFKWQMYTIGRYCDEMVPDGRGGLEPRFKAGFVLTTREQAYKLLSDLAAIFRGMAYWANTDIGVVQDAPSDPAAHYTNANVVAGKFTYNTSSHSKRPTQVTVWFNDLSQQGKLVPETYVDTELERRYGVRQKQLSPLGIWSRGQARRLAKWVMYSEEHEGSCVAFRVGLDGVLTPPGKVFEIADQNEAGERLGGRVRSATMTAVTLDAPVTLRAGEVYLLKVMLPDATDPAKLVPQERGVTNGPGATTVLTVAVAFSAAPAAQSVWLLKSDEVQPTTWRCLSLNEVPDTNEFEITALRHYPQKYDLIEQGIAFELPSISRIRSRPSKPTDLALVETLYLSGTQIRIKSTLSWVEPYRGLRYLVTWRLANGPWTDLQATPSNCVDIDDLQPGLLEVRVKSVNGLGNSSPAAEASLLLLGKAAPPSNVAGLVGTASNGVIVWRWTACTDVDYDVTEARAGGTDWASAAVPPAFRGTANIYVQSITAVGSYTLRVRHIDSSGNLSAATASATVNVVTGDLGGTTGYSLAITVYRASATPPNAPSGGSYKFAGDVFVAPLGWSRTRPPPGPLPVYASSWLFETTTPTVVIPGPVGAFTPPTGPFPTNLAGDALWANVVLSLPFNGANAATTTTDVSSYARAISVFVGTAKLTTTSPISGSASLLLDGTQASGVPVPYAAELNFAGADFCIEGFGIRTGTSGFHNLIDFRGTGPGFGAGSSWTLNFNAATGAIGIYDGPTNAGPVGSAAGVVPLGSLFHWAVQSDAGVVSIMIDGALVASGVYAVPATHSTGVRLAYNPTGLGYPSFAGRYDDLRATRAALRYSAGGWPAPWLDQAPTAALGLAASAASFTFDGLGAGAPSSQTITVTASPTGGLSGTATFVATLYTSAGASLGTVVMGGSGNARTLTAAQFVSLGAVQSAVVAATLSGYTAQVTINRVQAAAPSVQLRLSATSVAILSDATGYISSYANATTTASVSVNGVDDTANWTFPAPAATAGVTVVAAGTLFSVTNLTVDFAQVPVTATRTGYPTQSTTFNVTRVPAAGTASGPVAPRFTANAGGGGTVVAAVRFNVDGSVSVRQGRSAVYINAGNWYVPTTGSVGSGYYIKAVPRGGYTGSSAGTSGAWVPLSSAQTFSEVAASPGDDFESLMDYQISTSSTGTPVVATGGQVYLHATA